MQMIDVELFVIMVTFLLSRQTLTIIDKKGSFGENIIYALLVVCSKHKFYDGKTLEVVVLSIPFPYHHLCADDDGFTD